MIILEAADTLAADADAGSVVTCTVFGMELNAGTETYKILDQRQLSATPGTIYTAPSSTTTFIRSISIINTDTASHTFQLFVNGTANTNAITPIVTLAAGYSMCYEDGLGWQTFSATGKLQKAYGPYVKVRCYGTTGSLAETLDRNYLTEVNTSALSSGRLQLQAIWLTAGMRISSISFCSATTALATGTNQLFGLFDVNRNLLATTNNDTSTAWAANSIKTLSLTSAYVVPSTGLYYLGIMIAATTVPTLKGSTALTATQLHATTPIICGTSTTGLTTALPNPAAAISATTTTVWGSVA